MDYIVISVHVVFIYTFVTLWTFIHGKEKPEELNREWDALVYSTVCELSRNHEFHGFIIVFVFTSASWLFNDFYLKENETDESGFYNVESSMITL